MDRIATARYRVRAEGLFGRPEKPFSFVMLADLHNRSYGADNCDLLALIAAQKPKAVLLAGDMITAKFGRVRMEEAMRLMGALTSRWPVYAVNGNHEQRLTDTAVYGGAWETYLGRVRSLGVQLLRNAREDITVQGMRMAVCGYEMEAEDYKHPGRIGPEEIASAIGPAPGDRYTILLAHHPDCFGACAAWGADLTLSGHKHGGMVRLPLIGPLAGPGPELFPRRTRGMYLESGRRLIVSAGLGGHTIPIRINNPPELVVIDFL